MIIEKDILTVDKGVICQQVNCQGVMGAGLALKIRNKWPAVYTSYRKAFEEGKLSLGYTGFVKVGQDLWVANCAGQFGYGRSSQLYTNYTALRYCFVTLEEFRIEYGLSIHLPYMFGCGLANGNWDIVYEMIENYITNPIICKHS